MWTEKICILLSQRGTVTEYTIEGRKRPLELYGRDREREGEREKYRKRLCYVVNLWIYLSICLFIYLNFGELERSYASALMRLK